jgi:hypothetical protein
MENDIDRQKSIWKEGIQNILTGNCNEKECGQNPSRRQQNITSSTLLYDEAKNNY